MPSIYCTTVKKEEVIEESITEQGSEDENERQSKPTFPTKWAQYEVVVHPALRPAVPISSRNVNVGTSTTSNTIMKNTRKRERSESDESEKENLGCSLPKRRRIVSNFSMRGELSNVRKVLDRVEKQQKAMRQEIKAIHDAVENGLGRIYDILEGGSSQVAI
ncbi:hypothetical protein M422DRAFT_246182 [Sphaerobolus stellatus SS14]|nr:hypothetical protein M422DRAFT_246182 [Sphaerobolus stellatus SS14]